RQVEPRDCALEALVLSEFGNGRHDSKVACI
ncbi:MAG: hypothetical protein RL085_855, partial [Actinomycetota bacterium]